MKLELSTYRVREVGFSSDSHYADGILAINKQAVEALLKQDERIIGVQVDLARPGEKTRIIHILDIVEPRTKPAGGSIFPGFLGPPKPGGQGRTRRLAGVAVMQCAELPRWERGLLFAREEIVDMSGPGSSYTPFSRTTNMVLTFEPQPGLAADDFDSSVRLAGLKVAKYLADLTEGSPPDEVEVFELTEPIESLPKVAYICQIVSTGPLIDTFLYGEPIRRLVPTYLHPNELMDGAIVNGSYTGSTSIPTYIHCNNPVVKELYSRHGEELCFLGVILSVGASPNPTTVSKERSGYFAAKLAKCLGAQGAIITQESGGNSIVDQMLTCRCCEELGIKTALVTYEMGGNTGADSPLIYMVPEADAMVTTGNREEKIWLPPVDKVIGGKKILYAERDPFQGMELFVDDIAASVDQTGFSGLTAKSY